MSQIIVPPAGGSSGGDSGTVNSGTTNQICYYASNGDVISGASASAILNILGFVTASQSISGTGYYTLPGGLILQWVKQSINSGFQNDINFPTAFPNNCFGVWATGVTNSSGTITAYISTYIQSKSQYATNNSGNVTQAFILALGN